MAASASLIRPSSLLLSSSNSAAIYLSSQIKQSGGSTRFTSIPVFLHRPVGAGRRHGPMTQVKSCPPTSEGLSLGGPASKLLLDDLIALASRVLKLHFVENRHSPAPIGNDARSA